MWVRLTLHNWSQKIQEVIKWEYLISCSEKKGKKEKVEEPGGSEGKQPKFVRKYTERGGGGIATYEIFKGTDAGKFRTP